MMVGNSLNYEVPWGIVKMLKEINQTIGILRRSSASRELHVVVARVNGRER